MSYDNPRIDLTDDAMSAVAKMADGNPGALNVLVLLFTKSEEIDPDAMLGGFGNILSLDTHDIYGARIWQFYKDLCGQDLVKMIGLMRAVQLGFMPESELYAGIDGRATVDIDGYMEAVRARLPRFAKA